MIMERRALVRVCVCLCVWALRRMKENLKKVDSKDCEKKGKTKEIDYL